MQRSSLWTSGVLLLSDRLHAALQVARGGRTATRATISFYTSATFAAGMAESTDSTQALPRAEAGSDAPSAPARVSCEIQPGGETIEVEPEKGKAQAVRGTDDRTRTGGGAGTGGESRADSREPVDASIDYYAVLVVLSTAHSEAIKKAYRRLIKQYHPDLNPGSQEALDKTKALNQAYDVLGKPERRREYDRERSRASERGTEAGRSEEGERRARYGTWRAREAASRAEKERRAREGRGSGRRFKRKGWCVPLAVFAVLAVIAGAAYFAQPYLERIDQQDAVPAAATVSTPTPEPTATPGSTTASLPTATTTSSLKHVGQQTA